jgi:hypothetical protein
VLQLLDQWFLIAFIFVIALRQGAPGGDFTYNSYSHINHDLDPSQHVPAEKEETAL